MPIFTVSVERLFSMARDVLPYRRNRLTARMIRAIMINKDWNWHVEHLQVDEEDQLDQDDDDLGTADQERLQEA